MVIITYALLVGRKKMGFWNMKKSTELEALYKLGCSVKIELDKNMAKFRHNGDLIRSLQSEQRKLGQKIGSLKNELINIFE